MTCHRRMFPLAGGEPIIGRAFAVRANSQERTESVPRIRDDHRSRLNCLFHKACQRARADDVRLVDLDMIAAPKVATDTVAPLADHASPQLMQDLERGFVSSETKLALELHGRHAGRHGGDQIRAPKPRRQWRVRPLHHGPDRERRLLAALPAGQHASPRSHAERLALLLAVRAIEVLRPLRTLQVPRARGVIGEKPLEVFERLGEQQVFPLGYVGVPGHGSAPPSLDFFNEVQPHRIRRGPSALVVPIPDYAPDGAYKLLICNGVFVHCERAGDFTISGPIAATCDQFHLSLPHRAVLPNDETLAQVLVCVNPIGLL